MIDEQLQQDISGWHHRRDVFANSYLKTLFSGVILSTTVISPPKGGLTSFFINDLLPHAIEEGYTVIYVDLSDKNVPVSAAFLMGLEKTMLGNNSGHVKFNFFKGLFTSVKNEKISAYLSKGNYSVVDQEYFEKNIQEHIEIFDSKIKKISEKSPLLIIVDHAENLRSNSISLAFSSYFKELLVGNRFSIKPIYGMNSLEEWANIFKDNTFSLYSEGASVHNLPPLDRSFVRVVLSKAALSVHLDEAMHCFSMVKAQPGVFIAILIGWDKSSGKSLSAYFAESLEMKLENDNALMMSTRRKNTLSI